MNNTSSTSNVVSLKERRLRQKARKESKRIDRAIKNSKMFWSDVHELIGPFQTNVRQLNQMARDILVYYQTTSNTTEFAEKVCSEVREKLKEVSEMVTETANRYRPIENKRGAVLMDDYELFTNVFEHINSSMMPLLTEALEEFMVYAQTIMTDAQQGIDDEQANAEACKALQLLNDTGTIPTTIEEGK